MAMAGWMVIWEWVILLAVICMMCCLAVSAMSSS